MNNDFIAKNKFVTNRTYDNYEDIPSKSGVYLIVNRSINKNGKINYEILYIGSSKNLKSRLNSHEVYRILKYFYNDIVFFFKEEKEYYKKEKGFISLIKPKFNRQWL